jgi:hypothetical protein
MFKMGLRDPFGHLEHKLWPKEGPLKVGNCPNFLTCRWLATYHWKDLHKGNNFSSNFISIKSVHTKLWAPKVVGDLTLRISGLPFVNLETKWHLGAGPMAKHVVYYKGEGGGFPQVQNVVSLVSSRLLVVCLCTKMLELRINQLVVWFVQVHVSNWIAY